MPMRENLLEYDRLGLEQLIAARGNAPFRARQIFRRLHRNETTTLSACLVDLPQPLRQTMAQTATLEEPALVADLPAADGSRKLLFSVGDDERVEAVILPERRRVTLCVSSQVGCALACRFCLTGKQGFSRNLSTAQIIAQVRVANRLLAAEGRAVTNVVMMGMGEPLLNTAAVFPALRLMTDALGYGLAARRVTVSTAGIVPALERLRDECKVSLAVSLHAAVDSLRDELMPINRKYPLAQLLAACRRYIADAPRAYVTFEYVMLDGVNDSDACARDLTRLLHGLRCKINLIPFNPFDGAVYRTSPPERTADFRARLMKSGLMTTIRRTRGDDILAACGQLAGGVKRRVSGLSEKPLLRRV